MAFACIRVTLFFNDHSKLSDEKGQIVAIIFSQETGREKVKFNWLINLVLWLPYGGMRLGWALH